MSIRDEYEKYKRRTSRKRLTYTIVIAFLAIVALLYLVMGFFPKSSDDSPSQPSFTLKAAIVDQLNQTFPNQTFIRTATNILEQAGYSVTYHPDKNVTVDFYRKLPSRDYSLIILRMHSTATIRRGNTTSSTYVVLFTNELYTGMYGPEEILPPDQPPLVEVHYTPYTEDNPAYYGITPNFVRLSMVGRFRNTVILVMGCEGLRDTQMAEAFKAKGAKVYISWNASVSASHNDLAARHLLQNLITKKQTVDQAVENTMNEVRPDPFYHSTLQYYPSTAGEETILSTIGDPIVGIIERKQRIIILKPKHCRTK